MYRKIVACLAALVLLSCCAPARAQDAADGIFLKGKTYRADSVDTGAEGR